MSMKITSNTIRLEEPYGDIGTGLKCPRCRDSYLHQGRVRVFDRVEDASWTTVTSITNGVIDSQGLSSADCGNPSPRRHGLIIDFTCEICAGVNDTMEHTAPIELSIFQHKGCTYLAWRYDPEMSSADMERVFR